MYEYISRYYEKKRKETIMREQRRGEIEINHSIEKTEDLILARTSTTILLQHFGDTASLQLKTSPHVIFFFEQPW